MNYFVLDSSAIIRLFIPDGPIPEGLEKALGSAAKAESIVLSPELAQAEVSQVITKKIRSGFLSLKEGKEILAAFLDLPIIYLGHREYLKQAFLLAHEYNLSVYDSLFLEMARSKNCNLISADQALLKAHLSLKRRRKAN